MTKTFKEIQDTYSASQIYPTMVTEADRERIDEYFHFRHVCDEDEKFLWFFRRALNTYYPRYQKLLELELSEIPDLIDYRRAIHNEVVGTSSGNDTTELSGSNSGTTGGTTTTKASSTASGETTGTNSSTTNRTGKDTTTHTGTEKVDSTAGSDGTTSGTSKTTRTGTDTVGHTGQGTETTSGSEET